MSTTIRTLFDPTDSPQTGVTNANSPAFIVWSKGDKSPGVVTIQASGTWSSGSLKVEVAVDNTTSPINFTTATVLDPSAGTASDAVLTANGTLSIEVAEGTLIRGVISGTGSPLPSLTVKARGHLHAT